MPVCEVLIRQFEPNVRDHVSMLEGEALEPFLADGVAGETDERVLGGDWDAHVRGKFKDHVAVVVGFSECFPVVAVQMETKGEKVAFVDADEAGLRSAVEGVEGQLVEDQILDSLVSPGASIPMARRVRLT